MLILSRKQGESVIIDGRIEVKVVRVEGGIVKLGFAAPADVPIHRREVYEEIQQDNKRALLRHATSAARPPLPRLTKPSPTQPAISTETKVTKP